MKDIQPAENHTLSATLLLLTVTGAIVISISIIQYSHLLKTEQDLRKCAKVMQDSVIQENASLDGVSIKGLDKYRVQSPAFTFTLGRNNILGLPAQSITQYVSDGNWVFLKPLPVGNHSIQFKGGLRNIDTNARGSSKDKYTFAGPNGWDPPVTYRLTIAKS